MKINSKIKFADEKIKQTFFSLKDGRTEEKELFESLNKTLEQLEKNSFCGIQIPKKLIPREYTQKYGIDNCWKHNLPNGWRLIYAIERDEVIILSIILEWMTHKEYERRFGY
ncbi:MAG: hypothetical protein WCW13_03260 [archaeon]|jgi:Txe/YoeB family toxin of Txe-Axe toxin-antitoxin module